jgi:G3E family GTPase
MTHGAPAALSPATLRALILDTLELWAIAGGADWHGGALLVTAGGHALRIRPASEAERPARWFLLRDAPRAPRPALSILGLLGALRQALGVPPARRLRIAPRDEPQAPAGPKPASRTASATGTPVLVVTGFLGSGKTTLVARMLRDPAFARTAVIVNEWGEVGIDHDLIAAASDAPLQLATGCLCCVTRGDLAETLLDLDRRRRAGEVRFDRVVIETSGLADPAPILHALMTDPAIATRFQLDGVVTLVDALHGEASLEAHVEARQQVSLADRVLLTKTDVDAPSESLHACITALNPQVPLRPVTRGDIPPSDLFGAGRERLVLPTLGARTATQHTDGLRCAILAPADPMPAAALALLLRALAELADGRLLRAKGLVRIAERPEQPALVQGVQHVFEPPEWMDHWPPGEEETRLVLIATGMPARWPARLYAAIAAEVRDETRRRTAGPRAV